MTCIDTFGQGPIGRADPQVFIGKGRVGAQRTGYEVVINGPNELSVYVLQMYDGNRNTFCAHLVC